MVVELIENAILGWGDDQIALWLRIRSPTPTQVSKLAMEWAPPLLAMGVLMYGYHIYSKKTRFHISW